MNLQALTFIIFCFKVPFKVNILNVMKNKKYINMDSERDVNLIKIKMMDNGDWEYDRLGIGECEGKVFIVDLDREEMEVEMEFVKEGLSIKDVLSEGVDLGVIVEWMKGYDEDDKYRVNWDSGWDEVVDSDMLWGSFYKGILVNDKL